MGDGNHPDVTEYGAACLDEGPAARHESDRDDKGNPSVWQSLCRCRFVDSRDIHDTVSRTLIEGECALVSHSAAP